MIGWILAVMVRMPLDAFAFRVRRWGVCRDLRSRAGIRTLRSTQVPSAGEEEVHSSARPRTAGFSIASCPTTVQRPVVRPCMAEPRYVAGSWIIIQEMVVLVSLITSGWSDAY